VFANQHHTASKAQNTRAQQFSPTVDPTQAGQIDAKN
jgi:hypothetical protein